MDTHSNVGKMITALLEVEGGYVDDPLDSGGETNFGISKRQFPNLDIKGLTEAKARGIYERTYFYGPGYDKLPTYLQPIMFDYGVNSGPMIATKALQRVVRVKEDGVLGPKTLAAVEAYPEPERLVKKVAIERLTMLMRLVGRRPKDVRFARGWVSRVMDFV